MIYEELYYVYSYAFLIFGLSSLFFTLIGIKDCYKINQKKNWWSNRSIKTDIYYILLSPIFKIVLRYIPATVIYCFLLIILPSDEIYLYIKNGRGPMSLLPLPIQLCFYLLISDLLLYWNHRLFHMKVLWPLHAIHHGPVDVDWTTAYRFHPLNLVFGPSLVSSIMIILGTSPSNILYTAPFETFMAFFVHSNIKINLGYLKYIIATPVFHHWHHSNSSKDRYSNFGAIFAFWDIFFGTFYYPDTSYPTIYGIDNCKIEENFISQIIFPFKFWIKNIS